MKKIALYTLLLITAGFVSCKGKEWDTGEELCEMAMSWSEAYVNVVLNKSIKNVDTVLVSKNKTESASLKDSLFIVVHNVYNKQPDKDSVDVTSTLIQIRDSIIVKVDGYRYSQKYWAHLFTVDPGIINYEGKFHVDFYEIGKTTPWAWTEITYRKYNDSNYLYRRVAPVVHWY